MLKFTELTRFTRSSSRQRMKFQPTDSFRLKFPLKFKLTSTLLSLRAPAHLLLAQKRQIKPRLYIWWRVALKPTRRLQSKSAALWTHVQWLPLTNLWWLLSTLMVSAKLTLGTTSAPKWLKLVKFRALFLFQLLMWMARKLSIYSRCFLEFH